MKALGTYQTIGELDHDIAMTISEVVSSYEACGVSRFATLQAIRRVMKGTK